MACERTLGLHYLCKCLDITVLLDKEWRCCQTNANSSQFADRYGDLCSTKLLPTGKCSVALDFEFVS
jgi:hypothetical protein